MEKAKPVIGTILKVIINLLISNGAKLIITKLLYIFKVLKLKKAFRSLQSGKSMGKLIIKFKDRAIVSIS